MLILVAGITGFVGIPCAEAAIARGHSVRGLARSAAKLDKDLIQRLEGFEEMESIYDIAALDRAVAGVDAVICAYAALPEILLEGQLLLLRAAERAGVKIFHASSWNYDWSKSPLGQHESYDTLIAFWNHARLSSSIKPLATFTGAIPEFMFIRSPKGWDRETKTFVYCGDPTARIRYTTADDLAAYSVEAVLAPDAAKGGFIRVQSFEASPEEVVKAYEAARGGRIKAHAQSLGSLEDAENAVANGRATVGVQNWLQYIWYGYQVHMGRRTWDYEPVDCARFSSVKQTSLKEWFEANPEV
ncbi:NmrA-like family protein [Neofusicoccum parvum]|nr:NmrA-like family protein [Neofusicoccum parvum]